MSACKWFFGIVTVVLTAAGSLLSPARAADPAADSNGPGKPYLVVVGVGETLDDLRPFDPQDFARALIAG